MANAPDSSNERLVEWARSLVDQHERWIQAQRRLDAVRADEVRLRNRNVDPNWGDPWDRLAYLKENAVPLRKQMATRRLVISGLLFVLSVGYLILAAPKAGAATGGLAHWVAVLSGLVTLVAVVNLKRSRSLQRSIEREITDRQDQVRRYNSEVGVDVAALERTVAELEAEWQRRADSMPDRRP